ncbi:MAG: hypothetical protein ACJAU6_004072 [Alphaproteobacteria bacterium]|jgi:hypothetical protein
MPENSATFYADLPGFHDFSEVTDLSLYQPLPDDWLIVLADIKGSTKAISEGRYKDVNMIGLVPKKCRILISFTRPSFQTREGFCQLTSNAYAVDCRSH